MTRTVDKAGRIIIPAEVRKRLEIDVARLIEEERDRLAEEIGS